MTARDILLRSASYLSSHFCLSGANTVWHIWIDDANGPLSELGLCFDEPADMAWIAQAFGLQYLGRGQSDFLHHRNIVLIGPDGTVAKSWLTRLDMDGIDGKHEQALHSSGQ